ncbi:MAG: hypothetical protein K0R41_2850 [Geminicoccaceae bacterium]|jgi:hypothetical protein|nr:hypothetical protein [Geminicoccaceae bacterium]MCE3249025.1 hypothetical protein [Geminicoccaceae bacterium]
MAHSQADRRHTGRRHEDQHVGGRDDVASEEDGSMARQRWGSFSVRDHLNTRALATDVLLYDRLIFPVPPEREEKALEYWRAKGWDPDLLQSRLTQLKGLTRSYRWGERAT